MAETNTPPNHAATKIRTLLITPDGGAPFLVVEVEIDCAVCGQHQHRFAGHHLASLAASFAKIVEDHPGLVGKLGRTTERVQWEAGVDPGKVSSN